MFAVILAGGAGTRLWPAARPDRPKQFLTLFGRASLFQQALRRVVPLVGRSRVLVVTGARHAAWVRRQAPSIPAGQVLVEEIGRNTAASIALAALWIRMRFGDAVMIVLPADHWIAPEAAFRTTLRRGVDAARRTGRLVTIGVPARSPEPGFGYILPASAGDYRGVRPAARFIEKPDVQRARRMVRSGRYLWNSGIFVWKASTILEQLNRHFRSIMRPLEQWASGRRRSLWRVPAAVLRRVPAQPIDRAILERTKDLLVRRATFRWSDLGNWSAVAEMLRNDSRGNAAIGSLVTSGASGCAAVNPGGLTALVGVRDLVVVREGKVVLVCARDEVQRVRELAGRAPAYRRSRSRGARR